MTLKQSQEGSYKEVLAIALPIVLSNASWTLQHFINRVFLSWYSKETVAASLPSGMVFWSFSTLFLGVTGYVNTFVAQYDGARRTDRIGTSLWQGIYFALFASVFCLFLYPLAAPFFRLINHDPSIQQLEVQYFQVLLWGMPPLFISSVLACFYTGRGKTWTLLVVNIITTLINIALDYLLIFGNWGFPRWGIKGAAVATNITQYVTLFLYIYLVYFTSYEKEFHLRSRWKFDKELFVRLIRFGLPNTIQIFLDTLAFTTFVLILGRLGVDDLIATNVAFNINMVAFMPMIGFGIATSSLVGQYLGKNKANIAHRCVMRCFLITFIYMNLVALSYVLIPDTFVNFYGSHGNTSDFEHIRQLSKILLRFVAVYSVFDTLNVIFSFAIKGAGDTKFAMIISVILSWSVMVLPTLIACVFYKKSLYWAWVFCTTYVILSGLAFLLRYIGGKWRDMRVIEQVPTDKVFVFPAPTTHPIDDKPLP